MENSKKYSYILSLADISVKLYSQIELVKDEIYNDFLSEEETETLYKIEVFNSEIDLTKAKKVFSAPFVYEKEGENIYTKNELWSVFVDSESRFIKTQLGENKCFVLEIPNNSKKWNLFCNISENKINPFQYPIGPLILYYLCLYNNMILLHASAVEYKGKTYIFSGLSGRGKTTITKLFYNKGAKVINDDRIILKVVHNQTYVYNNPVYKCDFPKKSKVDCVFMIRHCDKNILQKIEGIDAITSILSSTIQHNYNEEIINKNISLISQLTKQISVFQLGFLPDESVVNYIIENAR